MRKLLPISVLALLMGASMPAFADDDRDCTDAPRAEWMTKDAFKAKVEAMGYTNVRIEVDDGCYEVDARDGNGLHVEGDFHPVTGELDRYRTDD